MSEQEINIAIAEEYGWHDCSIVDGIPCGLRPEITSLNGKYELIPLYCNDLNAMHQVEKILSEKEQRDYSFRLFSHKKLTAQTRKSRLLLALVDGSVTNGLNDHFIYLTATARQRAEAFLRTIGKWEETK